LLFSDAEDANEFLYLCWLADEDSNKSESPKQNELEDEKDEFKSKLFIC